MYKRMIKTGFVLCSMLLFSISSATYYEFDNNIIEYEPAPSISLPYPYKAEHIQPIYKPKSSNVFVPAPTEVVEVVQPAGFISTAISCTFNAVKSVVLFFINRIPGLIVGIATALGICKLTSLCDSQITIYEAESELRSFATPERLSRAANFVKEALKKFSDMQSS